MGDDKRKLWGELKEALRIWGQDRSPDLVEEVTRIVQVNWQRDRACHFMSGGKVNGPQAYVERVGERYQRLSPYVRSLQVDKETEAWEELMEKLQLWSYNLLGRLAFPSNAVRYRRSVDLATDAAAEILTAHFPYDVDFEPWAYVLVRNVCYRYMRAYLDGGKIPPERLVNLEAYDGWLRNLVDERAEERLHEAAEREAWKRTRAALLAAIEDLPPSEKEVIRLYYFEGLTFEEMAKRTGKRANALYQYHFRALGKLRDALDGGLPPT